MRFRPFHIFLQFLYRDFYVYLKQVGQFVTNYSLIYPLSFAFSFGYLQAHILFRTNSSYVGTSIFAGNLLLILLLFNYKLTIPLLYDLEGDRYIDYQMVLLNPKLILLEKILFSSLFSFVILFPLFPITKLFLRTHLDTTHTSWITLFGILYLACLFLSSYCVLLACYIKKIQNLSRMWKRVNLPLLYFGGFLIPWYIMNNYSRIIGMVSFANPFIYVSEGIRQSLLKGVHFFSLKTSTLGIVFFFLLSTFCALYYFKKRVDYV